MKKRAIVGAGALLLAAAGAGAWWLARPGADGGGIVASGTVEATEADVGFEIPGRLRRLPVREGDRVAAGDLLGALDTSELDAAVAEAEAGVASARSALREMELGGRPEEVSRARAVLRAAERRAEDAARDLERARRLFDGGAISQEALERAETALTVAEADRDQARDGLALVREGPRPESVEAQRARVRQAEAALARARARLADAEVTAPFDGVVAIRHREAGETVSPGTPLITLRDLGDRWIRIYVREDAIGRVSLGQEAEILSDSHPDRTYDGRVFFIGSEAEFTPRNVQTAEERVRLVYPVKVRVAEDPDVELKPGTPADVRLLPPEGS
ncbi:MAG TPA: efflux RND transporter periplasmic adaptor subunit [Longimicrobiales bacterium]|nr:efflux RND transporter periplasmic adaptor subunit [Longimicrobiales bacterium]